VTELIWILDPTTGQLAVEGLTAEEASALAGDLLPPACEINCARPLRTAPLPAVSHPDPPWVRVARIYHGAVVDGPGRRSVCQFQGCTRACPNCYVPETHPIDGGLLLPVRDVLAALLDPAGVPRDGVTISGGEPFLQPHALLLLLQELKARRIHTVAYTGYTLEALARRWEPEVQAALRLTDLLVDGPYVAALAEGAGEWRGSRNQRLIPNPATALAADGGHPRSARLSAARCRYGACADPPSLRLGELIASTLERSEQDARTVERIPPGSLSDGVR
jgi:anaerobic ribonucleoside-triphosphate reductase activating protein